MGLNGPCLHARDIALLSSARRLLPVHNGHTDVPLCNPKLGNPADEHGRAVARNRYGPTYPQWWVVLVYPLTYHDKCLAASTRRGTLRKACVPQRLLYFDFGSMGHLNFFYLSQTMVAEAFLFPFPFTLSLGPARPNRQSSPTPQLVVFRPNSRSVRVTVP